MDAGLAAALLASLMLAAWAIGVRLGRGRGESPVETDRFEEAGTALLALLLSFTFAMAVQKYERRREHLIADTNAIGDFYTCASLIQEPTRSKLQAVIRDYAALRLDTARRAKSASEKDLAAVLPRFDQMHSRMTELVAESLRLGTTIPETLVTALNEVMSSQAARLAAIRDRLPASVFSLLCLSAILTSALIGRQQGSSGRLRFLGVFGFVVVVGFAVWVTLELNYPGRGMARLDQEPLERLIDSMRP